MTAALDIPPEFQGAVITIDGPAGSGKSTTARMLAARIGFAYLDTGAMYRSAAWLGLRIGTDLTQSDQVDTLLQSLKLRMEPDPNGTRIWQGDEDISQAIRTPEIDLFVSPISANGPIREFMSAWQRRQASVGNVVLEGRDTGTVVCPNAEVKIYLVAALETRARRRLLQRGESVTDTAMQQETAEITRRDKADTERDHSPLRQADDAILVDTSDLSLDEQIELVYQTCAERLAQRVREN
jgi:cytidylate kinase